MHGGVAVLTTLPLATRLGDGLPLGREPVATVPLFNLWSLQWTAQRLPHALSGWWDAPIFWPSRGTYAGSELQPLTGAVYALLHLVAGPATAYGLLVLVALALDGLVVAALARRLGASEAPAALAGILAQTAPFLVEQFGVLQLVSTWSIALVLERVLAW